METQFVVYKYFVNLNHRTAYLRMFGTSKCLRFYPHLRPLGSNSRFDYFSRMLSNSTPRPTTTTTTPTEPTVEEQLAKLKSNPYYEKYAAKIELLQKKDPKQFHTLLSKLVENSSNAAVPKLDGLSTEEVKAPHSSQQKKVVEEMPVVEEKSGLDAIVKLELMRKLTAEEIRELWVAYYADKDAVFAVIPADSYMMIKSIFEIFPLFVYPLPREDGFEMFVGQFANDVLHFTSLHNYQKLQEFAPDQLTLRHYTELQEEKEVVLMSGLVFDEGISVTDAQMLCYLVQHYCVNHPQLMRDFNRDPGSFSVDRVIAALDMTELMKKNRPVD